VEFGPDGHLHVGSIQKGEERGRPLRTLKFWHAFSLTAPLAVSVAGEHDVRHIALLLPGGAALESRGSLRATTAAGLTGIQTVVSAHDLAEAIVTRFPVPPTLVPRPFNAVSVLTAPATHSGWGTIEPGPKPTSFVPGSVPPNWISATVAACTGTAGASCGKFGVGTSVPRNPPPSEPQLVSTTPVTVKSLLSWAGRTVELLVTVFIMNTGQPTRYMTWTDLYRQMPAANGPLTFPGVIVATGTPPPNPPPAGHTMTWAQETASDYTYITGGAPTKFELRVNGITLAFRSCEYLGHYPGGTPELRCS
jgi:hypothetical protein